MIHLNWTSHNWHLFSETGIFIIVNNTFYFIIYFYKNNTQKGITETEHKNFHLLT